MVICDIMMTMSNKERPIPAAEFKASCLALLDTVANDQRSFIVTKRGRPVARVVPLHSGGRSSLQGSLLDDQGLMGPVDAEWDAAP